MTLRDLREPLKEEEASRTQRGMPADSRAAVRLRLRGTLGHARARSVPWRVLAAVAAAGLLGLVTWSLWQKPHLGSLELLSASSDLKFREPAPDRGEIEAGVATLLDAATGTSVQNVGPMSFLREAEGVRIVRGTAEVRVTHRPLGSRPVVVLTSGGAIEVMGTRFTVEQREKGGVVTLREGAIRFRPTLGSPIELRPGQSLEWPIEQPLPAPPAPAVTPVPPTPEERASKVSPPRRVAPIAAVDDVLREVEVLRSRKQFEGAVQLLREALGNQPPSTHERLSFELGSILTHQLHDVPRACAHWAAHQRRFARGRYREELEQAKASLSCGNGP